MALTTMSKVNFWNALRVDKNIRYKDLAELFDNGVSTWGKYFSGQIMPSDDVIEKLCDLFDVPFEKGKEEFEIAHAEWVSSDHKGKREMITGESVPYERTQGEMPARITVGEASREPKKEDKKTDIISLIYGKIPYDVFAQFCSEVTSMTGDPLRLIYGKVPYEDYVTVTMNLCTHVAGSINAD